MSTNKSSIHFNPIKSSSEIHFDQKYREETLDYVFNDRIKLNQSWVSEDLKGISISEYTNKLKTLVKTKTGRTMQSKATPVREGVVNLSNKTTMKDLLKLSKAMNKEFGLKTLRIELHEDEGYKNKLTGLIEYNRHAHIVVDWVDHQTGKSFKLSPIDTSRMQDITANVLDMERGKKIQHKIIKGKDSSGRETIKYKREPGAAVHLSPLDWKDKQEALKIDELEKLIVTKKGFLGKDKIDIEQTTDNLKDIFKALREMEGLANSYYHTSRKKTSEVAKKDLEIKTLMKSSIEKAKELMQYKSFVNKLTPEEFETVKKRATKTKQKSQGRGGME